MSGWYCLTLNCSPMFPTDSLAGLRVGAFRFQKFSLPDTDPFTGCAVCLETVCVGCRRVPPVRPSRFRDFGATLNQIFPSAWPGRKQSTRKPRFRFFLGPKGQLSGISGFPYSPPSGRP